MLDGTSVKLSTKGEKVYHGGCMAVAQHGTPHLEAGLAACGSPCQWADLARVHAGLTTDTLLPPPTCFSPNRHAAPPIDTLLQRGILEPCGQLCVACLLLTGTLAVTCRHAHQGRPRAGQPRYRIPDNRLTATVGVTCQCQRQVQPRGAAKRRVARTDTVSLRGSVVAS
eukprot:3616339-Rhodomonas_salina.1